MKRLLALSLIFSLFFPQKVIASELQKKRCTCYLDSGITASGCYTRPGVIAGRREDFGKVAAIYRCDTGDQMGEFIGYFEFLDTGAGIDTDGDGKGDSLIKGLSVDIYMSNETEMNDFISEYGDYVYIKYIDAKG